jgi:hypothetical protein
VTVAADQSRLRATIAPTTISVNLESLSLGRGLPPSVIDVTFGAIAVPEPATVGRGHVTGPPRAVAPAGGGGSTGSTSAVRLNSERGTRLGQEQQCRMITETVERACRARRRRLDGERARDHLLAGQGARRQMQQMRREIDRLAVEIGRDVVYTIPHPSIGSSSPKPLYCDIATCLT